LKSEDLVLGYFTQILWTDIDAILTLLSTISLIGILITVIPFLSKQAKYFYKKIIILKSKYILVCGLDENNSVYIDSEIKDGNNKIVIIVKDKDNPSIEKYKNKGLMVKIGDATDLELLASIKIEKAKHILVSTGQDLINLEIVTQVLKLDCNASLYVNIEDRHLRHFHKEQGIFESSSIKIYSYYEEASRDLFNKFNIDGNDNTIINSNKSFSIAIIGNSHLSHEVISQACIVGQLPNENILKVYCIDKDIKEFKQSVELNYTQIDKIQTVSLEYHSLDINSKSFYQSSIWHDNMTNVIICLEDEQKNLDIASNLANITYIDKIAEKTLNTNIIFAMFNDYNLTKNIKLNNKVFNNFYTFGCINEISQKDIIINEERDIQSKCVNYVYNNVVPQILDYQSYLFEYTKIDTKKPIDIDIEWKKLGYFKQESNRAVADHFKTKLKYLGLKYKKSNKDFQIIFTMNQSVYESIMNDTLRLKLAKNEHQRWNTFHFLNGFKKMKIISKEENKKLKSFFELKKEHMCLIPFDEFKNKSDELATKGYELGVLEGYDFMINEYIPFIMAKSGYEILLIENKEII